MVRFVSLTKKELYTLLVRAYESGLHDDWERSFNVWAEGELLRLDERAQRSVKRNGKH